MTSFSETFTKNSPVGIATLSGCAFTLFATVVLFEVGLFPMTVNALFAVSYGLGYGNLIYAHIRNTTTSSTPTEDAMLLCQAIDEEAEENTTVPAPVAQRRRSTSSWTAFTCNHRLCKDPNCPPKNIVYQQEGSPTLDPKGSAVMKNPESVDVSDAPLSIALLPPNKPAAIKSLYQNAQIAFLSFSGSVLLIFFLPVTPMNILVSSLSLCLSLYFYYTTYQISVAITPTDTELGGARYYNTLRAIDRALGIALLFAHAIFESVVPLAGLRTLFLYQEASLTSILGTGLLGLAGGVIKVKGELSAALPIADACDIQPNEDTDQPRSFQQLLIASKALLYLLTFLGLYKELASHLIFAFSNIASWPVAASMLTIGLSAIAAASWTWVLFQSAENHVCAHKVSSSLGGIGLVNLLAACTNGLIATAELVEMLPLASSLGSTGFLAITSVSFLAGMLIDSNFLSQNTSTSSHDEGNSCGVVERFAQDSVALSSAFKLTASSVCENIRHKMASNSFFTSADSHSVSNDNAVAPGKA